MKNQNLPTVVMAALLIIITSCQKENHSDSARLRISMIADNIAMENPTVCEYNSRGLLSKITNEDCLHEIIYNSNNLPIRINEYDLVWSNTSPLNITLIEWKNDGFIISDDEGNFKDVYQLNLQGKIEKKIALHRNYLNQQVFDTLFTFTYSYINENQLKLKCTYPVNSGEEEWEVNYKFGSGWSPFKGVNIALIATGAVGLSFCEEYQNTFCTIEYSSRYLNKTVVTYDLNEHNYPIRADEYSTDVDGSIHEYDYFKYESY